ncbi:MULTISPECIES: universal stress protein [Halomonadaceae]|uniref:universal stress protein n=1 Tax=Halomonadaceae TaxID=28256 RepID=UPI00159A9C7D|nr:MULTISPECIES: universal stress protein [Halomonas]QJQ95841.1 universal stress protein [Halomonas sp. PA5]
MYDKILLPIDLNEETSWAKALPTALTLCRTFDAALQIVTVLPDYRMPMVGSFFPKDFATKAHRALAETLREFVAREVPDDVKVKQAIIDGSPWEAIIKAAKKIDADLIVMASHNKRKFADYVLGPNAEHVVHHSKISVMIVR